MFSLNTKMILQWISSEKTIRKSTKGSKHAKKRRPAKYPAMEEKLHYCQHHIFVKNPALFLRSTCLVYSFSKVYLPYLRRMLYLPVRRQGDIIVITVW